MLIHSSRVCDPWRGGHALACESAYRMLAFASIPWRATRCVALLERALRVPDEVTEPSPTTNHRKPRYHNSCYCLRLLRLLILGRCDVAQFTMLYRKSRCF